MATHDRIVAHELQARIMECDRALDALKDTPRAYRIIGGLMVEKDIQILKKELSDERNAVVTQLESVQKGENR